MARLNFLFLLCALSSCIMYTSKYGGNSEFSSVKFQMPGGSILQTDGFYLQTFYRPQHTLKKRDRNVDSVLCLGWKFYRDGTVFCAMSRQRSISDDSSFLSKRPGYKDMKGWGFYRFQQDSIRSEIFFYDSTSLSDAQKIPLFWKRQITRYPFDLFVSPGKIDFVCPLLDYRLLSSRFMKSITAPDSSVNFLKNKKFRKTMGLEPLN